MNTSLRLALPVSISVALAMGGCSSVLPVAANYSNEQVIAKSDIDAAAHTSLTLAQAKKLANGWKNIYLEAQATRQEWQSAFGETIFYGSILAVLGIVTHHDRVRNLGLVLAGGAGLADGHYKLAVQRAAFRKAESRMACIERAMLQITPANVATFDVAGAVRETLTSLPVLVVEHAETVRGELRKSLLDIELTTPSRQEISDAFTRLKEAEANVPRPAALTTNERAKHINTFGANRTQSEQEEQKQAFLAALAKVKAEFGVCVKAG